MSTIFIKMLTEDGQFTGYAVSGDGKFGKDISTKISAADSLIAAEVSLDKEIEKHTNRFVSSMLAYLDFVPIVMMMLPILGTGAVTRKMRQFLKRNAVTSKTLIDGEVFEIDRNQYNEFSRLTDHLEPSLDAQHTMGRNAMMGLVAALDVHLADLMKTVMLSNSKLSESAEEKVSLSEAIQFESFEDFKSAIISREIERVGFEGLGKQVEWFEKRTKLEPEISKQFKRWGELNEVIQRRN